MAPKIVQQAATLLLSIEYSWGGSRNHRRRPRRYLQPSRHGWLLLLLSWYGHTAWAQDTTCPTSGTTRFQVQSQADAIDLNAAVNCTGGGQISAVWSGSVALGDDGFVIGEGTFLTVSGENSAEVVGTGDGGRIFRVSENAGLHISNMTLRGGLQGKGGAILSTQGTVRLQDCVLVNNTATDEGGGAVFADGGEVTIVGGEFVNNTAVADSGLGGAIHAFNAKLIVRNSTRFETNWALEGGAIYCAGSDPWSSGSNSSCSLEKAYFFNNNVSSNDVVGGEGGAGGAVKAHDANLMVLDSTWFEANRALSGGALSCTGSEPWSLNTTASCVVGSAFFLYNSGLFSTGNDNSTDYGLYGAGGMGGAIHVADAELTVVNNTRFHQNWASFEGGAIHCAGSSPSASAATICHLERAFFVNNAAGNSVLGGAGGAIFAYDTSFSVLDNSRFEENWAMEGGAIYCGGSGIPSATPTVSCFLHEVTFNRNAAFIAVKTEIEGYDPGWDDPLGGGALSFLSVEAEVLSCLFEYNFAQLSGGALFGGVNTTVAVEGCTFRNNTTLGYGSAVASTTLSIAGSSVESNYAGQGGGGVFVMSGDGQTDLEGINCTDNVAAGGGGCVFSAGRANIQDTTLMRRNEAENGGCIYAVYGSDVLVSGGNFTCKAETGGGFLFVSDGGKVEIEGGAVEECIAGTSGGVVHCSGDGTSDEHALTISGGTFQKNRAGEVGGVLHVANTSVLVVGGDFARNRASSDGGFISLEEGGFVCEGIRIEGHRALDRGGAVFANLSSWIDLSCDIVDNQAVDGGGIYVSNSQVALEDMNLSNNYLSYRSSSELHIESGGVKATGVAFDAGDDIFCLEENKPILVGVGGTFQCESCSFGGWGEGTVITNSNPEDGSLVLDDCDLSQSSPSDTFVDSESFAKVRNTRVSDATFESVSNPYSLVGKAFSCTNISSACGTDVCMNFTIGVLCDCSEAVGCLHDGGELSLEYKNETFSSSVDGIFFELVVTAGANGTTDAIWQISHSSRNLELKVFPSAGILSPGTNTTVEVTGTPVDFEAGGTGDFTTTFVLDTVETLNGTETPQSLVIDPEFSYCGDNQYAIEEEGNDGNASIKCQQCLDTNLDLYPEGVDCSEAGATLASLRLYEGFWRSSNDSTTIHVCLNSVACSGGVYVTSPNDYCHEGYMGPYCAVCSDGYGRGPNGYCYSCEGYRKVVMFTLVGVVSLVALCFLTLLIIFLVGGLDAVNNIGQSIRSGSMTSADRTAHGRTHSLTGTSGRSTFSGALEPSSGDIHEVHAFDSATYALPTRGEGGIHVDETRRNSWFNSRSSQEDIRRDSENRSLSLFETESAARARSYFLEMQDLGRRDISENPSTRRACWGCRSCEEGGTCCRLGQKFKRCISKIPWDKIRILVVVWQILTIYPTVANFEYPKVYSRFLNWVDIVNFDLGRLFSTSCLMPDMGHYENLIATTMAPLMVGMLLVSTYHVALARAGIGSEGLAAKQSAWARHLSLGLLVSFLVFTSTSTVIFQTFSCDEVVIEGESWLRADYRLSCSTRTHFWFEVYGGVMLMVYPVGIPLTYFCILWKDRKSLSQASVKRGPSEEKSESEEATPHWGLIAGTREGVDKEDVDARWSVPELVPSILLWKDYQSSIFLYEVVECGRRIMLTGALVFIQPNTTEQAAIACTIAFVSVLGFELLRPHIDNINLWLYRLGCVVIFISNFLALLIKAHPTGEDEHSILAVLLVVLNVILLLAVVTVGWLTAKDSDFGFDISALETAKTMLVADHVAGAGDPRRRLSRGPNPFEPGAMREESSRTVVHVVGERMAM